MNKVVIIGNLTKNPELRTTPMGDNVCSFTVAVNRRKKAGAEPEADFFNVSVWREQGENCAKYLSKGRKVCVVGSVSARGFIRNDGTAGASLEVQANEVEFLSPKGEDGGENGYSDQGAAVSPVRNDHGATMMPEPQPVDIPRDELPF